MSAIGGKPDGDIFRTDWMRQGRNMNNKGESCQLIVKVRYRRFGLSAAIGGDDL
jgi:hypothetical protein